MGAAASSAVPTSEAEAARQLTAAVPARPPDTTGMQVLRVRAARDAFGDAWRFAAVDDAFTTLAESGFVFAGPALAVAAGRSVVSWLPAAVGYEPAELVADPDGRVRTLVLARPRPPRADPLDQRLADLMRQVQELRVRAQRDAIMAGMRLKRSVVERDGK